MFKKKIIVGARGSTLSIKQAEEVIQLLQINFPSYTFIFKPIATKGDKLKHALSNERGMFVKEIEAALLKEEIDVAVHSLKDLPTELPKELLLGAVTKRLMPNDVFIPRTKETFLKLKRGSLIGTSSTRRKSQVLLLRRDVCVVALRGNVDTRLRKLKEGRIDGIICAWCALRRLGVKNVRMEKLSLGDFLPAPAQGSLGIEVRIKDKEMRKIIKCINDEHTSLCVKVERDFLKHLGGGCRLPLGAYAQVKGGFVQAQGFVAQPDGLRAIRVKETTPIDQAHDLGKKLARRAIEKGALEILASLLQG